ncbi:LytTR family DNA-binding domain-containing protein [Kineosporia sp. NBRC 101731]|uniref:LytR/AlgR family response regulator transcription factor n=1 Tax=Kineosporia sp. NBRC 101731 TaxID=3032199 RepID=UPI00332B7CD5
MTAIGRGRTTGPRWTHPPDPAPLRALIVDPDGAALARMTQFLRADPRISAVRTTRNRAGALQILRDDPVDLLVCDVSTPGLDGPHLARALARIDRHPHLVFTVPARQHPPRSFELDSVEYVDKPVTAERLAEAVRRTVAASTDETIAVELAGVTRFIRRSQILFVQAQGDYARLHTATGSHLIRVPLTTLEERWEPYGFLRIHRSTMVALPHVDEVRTVGGRMRVRLRGRTLQVSRRQGRHVREVLLAGAGEPPPRADHAERTQQPRVADAG